MQEYTLRNLAADVAEWLSGALSADGANASVNDRALTYALILMVAAIAPAITFAVILALWYRYLWHVTTDIVLFSSVALFCVVILTVVAYAAMCTML